MCTPVTMRGFRACSPLFVTWNKDTRQGDTRLRGCIGTLEPRHLHNALKDYALTRWLPVQSCETC